ncbi:MAG: radical SAM protein [Endomicrobiia bacterium]|nr:radical SAM protein [Endomicrobiia bacterium]
MSFSILLKKKVSLKSSDKLFLATYRANIPLTVIFEITRDCNLACRHCYIPSADRKLKGLPTEKVKKILRDAARAGAMYVIFTGGEIFLRRDIFEIIAFAKNLRFDVRLFTNATLLDAKKIRRIAGLGVSAVETSLYGAASAHDFITRSAGSHAKTVLAIDGLLGSGVRAVVKTPLMKTNFSERSWLLSFAKKREILCRFDPLLAPSDDGGKGNLRLRLGPAELETVYREFGPQVPPDLLRDVSAPRPRREKLVYCGAGRNFAAVSCDGILYPCLQLKIPLGDLKEKSFGSIWKAGSPEEPLAFIRRAELDDNSPCASCLHLEYCQRCPGLALLEEGDIAAAPSVSCLSSQVRRKVSRRV